MNKTIQELAEEIKSEMAKMIVGDIFSDPPPQLKLNRAAVELAQMVLDENNKYPLVGRDDRPMSIEELLWTKWLAHLKKKEITEPLISLADQQAFFEIAQPLIMQARQEQKEKDAKIAESYDNGIGGGVDPLDIAEAIRDN